MYKIFNNVEGIYIFEGNQREFIEFIKKIASENGDSEIFIFKDILDAIEYLENYCNNLELEEIEDPKKKNIERVVDWFKETNQAITLESLLQEIDVMRVAELDNHNGNPMLEDWFAVSDTNGIIAYFGEIEEALHYRLDYINRILNTVS